METIAITYWNTIISPTFDSACCLLIIRPDQSRFMIDIQNMSLPDKIRVCSEEGVSLLICGAISNTASTLLVNMNIRVFSWIYGPVEKIIDTYKKTGTITNLYFLPGCQRREILGTLKHKRCHFPKKNRSEEKQLYENRHSCRKCQF